MSLQRFPRDEPRLAKGGSFYIVQLIYQEEAVSACSIVNMIYSKLPSKYWYNCRNPSSPKFDHLWSKGT